MVCYQDWAIETDVHMHKCSAVQLGALVMSPYQGMGDELDASSKDVRAGNAVGAGIVCRCWPAPIGNRALISNTSQAREALKRHAKPEKRTGTVILVR